MPDAEAGGKGCLSVQAYLLVWLYVGIHNLAGQRGTAQRQKANQPGSPAHAAPAWQAAAGVLAAQGTPMEILAGADVLDAGDNVGEHVKYLSFTFGIALDLQCM